MGTEVGWLVEFIGIAVFAATLRQAFQAMDASRFRAMWGWYALTFLTSLIVALAWVSQGGQTVPVWTQNIILGTTGALAGVAIAIYAGHIVRDAQAKPTSPVVATPTPAPTLNPTNTMGNVSDNSGVVTQGQKGNNVRK